MSESSFPGALHRRLHWRGWGWKLLHCRSSLKQGRTKLLVTWLNTQRCKCQHICGHCRLTVAHLWLKICSLISVLNIFHTVKCPIICTPKSRPVTDTYPGIIGDEWEWSTTRGRSIRWEGVWFADERIVAFVVDSRVNKPTVHTPSTISYSTQKLTVIYMETFDDKEIFIWRQKLFSKSNHFQMMLLKSFSWRET